MDWQQSSWFRACDYRLSHGGDGLQVVDRPKFGGSDRDALRCETRNSLQMNGLCSFEAF